MRSTGIGLFVLVLGVGTIPSVASARRLEDWPYERLFKAADLVVIARPTTSEDCADRSADNPWKEEFIGVNTTFKVEAILKGKATGETIKVLHFRVKEGVLINDGPCHVTFRQKGIAVRTEGATAKLGAPEYLLFLKAAKEGRYEPVSGRVDPALSVREVSAPLNDQLGGK
jgi:hypothetical protein